MHPRLYTAEAEELGHLEYRQRREGCRLLIAERENAENRQHEDGWARLIHAQPDCCHLHVATTTIDSVREFLLLLRRHFPWPVADHCLTTDTTEVGERQEEAGENGKRRRRAHQSSVITACDRMQIMGKKPRAVIPHCCSPMHRTVTVLILPRRLWRGMRGVL